MNPRLELLWLRRDVVRQLLIQAYAAYYAQQAGLQEGDGAWLSVRSLEAEWVALHQQLHQHVAAEWERAGIMERVADRG